MVDDLEEEATELTPITRPVSGDNVPQRTVLYARKGAGSTQNRARRRPVAVPNWFDLPVLLPESNPVAARIQRNIANNTMIESPVRSGNNSGQSITPKVSRLGSREEEEERKVKKMGATVLKSAMRRRQNSRVRKLDGLGHVDRKNRLREKLWKDLSRFGLWPMAGPGDDDDRSVENTVDAIWTQWQNATETLPNDEIQEGSHGYRYDGGDDVLLETGDDGSGVFLTGVPSVSTTPVTPEVEPELSSGMRSVVFADGGAGFNTPEGEDNNEEEELSSNFGFSANRLQAKVQTPGLKRRKRLTDLHHFVGLQLQKRLFKSWDSIEIAFTGSGEMTVSQIVKFLQHSDVQLGNKDAVKVQQILENHVAATLATQEASEEEHYNQRRTKSRAVLSYEGFRQIFHPVDPQEASKWKREFDREKLRQRQEKDIYTKELAALEEKVRQRLANSAKQMIEHLQQFQCDPNDVPWENEQQRLQLRSQFLEVIFSKPTRRRILKLDSRLPHSGSIEAPGEHKTHAIPDKLSVKLILSTLLQKFSRNGHFESVPIP
ncbi:Hypothetical protein PHPALM_18255, partial [Phytophthora palmivora]